MNLVLRKFSVLLNPQLISGSLWEGAPPTLGLESRPLLGVLALSAFTNSTVGPGKKWETNIARLRRSSHRGFRDGTCAVAPFEASVGERGGASRSVVWSGAFVWTRRFSSAGSAVSGLGVRLHPALDARARLQQVCVWRMSTWALQCLRKARPVGRLLGTG